MTRPTDQLGDDDVGGLLTETFAAYEHLADADRAVAIAASPGRPRHFGRALCGVAAAVALVAGGSTYALTRGPDRFPLGGADHRSDIENAGDHEPPLPPLRTNAENLVAARRAGDRLVGQVPVYPGARSTSAIAALHPTYATFSVSGHTVTRTRWWTVGQVTSREVAQWYAAHPAPGLASDGGVGSTSRSGGPAVRFVTFSRIGQVETLPPVGAHVVVETTQLSSGVGVRVRVESIWPPARPVASYVQDVSSIDVRQTEYQSAGQHLKTVVYRYSEASQPGRILRAARAFNALVGSNPVELNCAMVRTSWTDRITFHTATGDVVAVTKTSNCGSGVTVYRDGYAVGPTLGYATALLKVLDLSH
jgi:hypothetical protein